uniref:Uncharacterized protein n=1 Tax=viral metagenome TaxID=1070528 RepID=A0A6C0LVF1_9ZZZZ
MLYPDYEKEKKKIKDFQKTYPFTPSPKVMPDIYKLCDDPVLSYRNYILYEKTKLLSLKGKIASREIPSWVREVTV